MAFVITVANAKGGVGKSSLAYCLACYYSKQNAKIGILDEDIQQTITDIIATCKERGEVVPIHLIDKNQYNSYQALADTDDYDIIFIDTPPVMTTQLERIYSISDMILIPIKPSTSDYNSLMRSIDNIKEAMNQNDNLITAIVINMAVKNSKVQESFRKAFEWDLRIKVLKTELANRVIHTKYILTNHSLFNSSDTSAKQEMAALGDEIYCELTQ